MLAARYELLEPVGRGAMSVVRRARDTVGRRFVAIKIPGEAYAENGAFHRQLLREGQTAMRVKHPCVVRINHWGDDAGPFIAMELLRGVTLRARLDAGPLSPPAAMHIAARIAGGLAAIHAAGIVHFDVKPSNIMLSANTVKVIDFGIAADAYSEGAGRRSDKILGTPAYVAPERLTGGPVGPPADIYALGVLLYQLLGHRDPWQAGSTMQRLAAHVSVPPAPLPAAGGVPAFVVDLCHRCLSKNPAARPDAHEAEALLSRGATAHPRPGAAAPHPRPGPLQDADTREVPAVPA